MQNSSKRKTKLGKIQGKPYRFRKDLRFGVVDLDRNTPQIDGTKIYF